MYHFLFLSYKNLWYYYFGLVKLIENILEKTFLSATSITKILETIISRAFQLVADVFISTVICYWYLLSSTIFSEL